jgi:uncharacterized protein with von Willebrand factor type A (vWA) domain
MSDAKLRQILISIFTRLRRRGANLGVGELLAAHDRTMSDAKLRQILISVFTRLRRRGVNLGVGELLAAVHAVESGLDMNDPDELQHTIELLWCHSLEEGRMFRLEWEEATAQAVRPARADAATSPPTALPPPKRIKPPIDQPSPPEPIPEAPALSSDLAVLPVRAPFAPAQANTAATLQMHWPVSRRSMVYAWRYLRRPLPDGPPHLLDVTATVEQAARQGFFLAPVYRRRERNHAQLALLIDQGGSMVPFHRFTRDMAETVRAESTLEQVDIYYFHNTPVDHLYAEPVLKTPIELERVLGQYTSDTSVLIVGDAGAARGHRVLNRIRATTTFLLRLKQQTGLIAWLNPMPQQRWPGTSAQIIAHLVPMFQMDSDGLSGAIDALRGQSPEHQGMRV